MYVASTAYLPSSFTMYLTMIGLGAWLQGSYEVGRVSSRHGYRVTIQYQYSLCSVVNICRGVWCNRWVALQCSIGVCIKYISLPIILN